jgi:hypothetical protein
MANPVAFNSGSNVNGSLKRSNISFGLSRQDYGSNPGGLTWYSGIEIGDNYLIYSDTYAQGTSTLANSKPVAWSCSRNDDALRKLINALPERSGQSIFNTLSDALSWLLASGKYSLNTLDLPPIVTDGMIVYMNGNSLSYPGIGSTVYNIASNSSNGTLTNGVSYSAGSLYFDFDGTDDEIVIPYSGNTTGTYSFELTVVSDTMSSDVNNRQTLFSLYKSGSLGYQIFDLECWGNEFRSFNGDGSSYAGPSGLGSTTFTQVQHLVITKDENNLVKLYKNGSLLGSYTLTYNSTFTHIALGSRKGGNFLNGKIFDFKAYNRVISSSEILQNLYQGPIITSGLSVFLDSTNPVSYPKTGRTWYDIASNFQFLYSAADVSSSYQYPGFFNMALNNSDYFGCTDTAAFNASNILNGTQSYTMMSFVYNLGNLQSYQVYFGGSTTKGSGFEIVNGRSTSASAPDANMWIEVDTATSNYPIHGNSGEGTVVPPYTTATVTGRWMSIASTYDGSFLRGYFNGNYTVYRSASGLSVNFLSGNSFPRVGMIPNHGLNEFYIAVNLVYNRVLSQSEIARNHDAIISRIQGFGQTGIANTSLLLSLDAGDLNSYPGSGDTWYDLSGNSNNATRINVSGCPIWNASGYFQFPASITGRNSGFLIPDASSLRNRNQVTVILVVAMETKTPISGDTDWMCMFSKSSTRSNQTPAVSVNQGNTGSWRYLHIETTAATNSSADLFTNSDYTGSTWNHLVATVSTSGTKGYKNGVQVSTSASLLPTSNTNPIYLGLDSDVELFKGKMAIVKFYNYALSSQEILDDYNSVKTRFNLP